MEKNEGRLGGAMRCALAEHDACRRPLVAATVTACVRAAGPLPPNGEGQWPCGDTGVRSSPLG